MNIFGKKDGRGVGLKELRAGLFGEFEKWCEERGIDTSVFSNDIWAIVVMFNLLTQCNSERQQTAEAKKKEEEIAKLINRYTDTLTLEEVAELKTKTETRYAEIKLAKEKAEAEAKSKPQTPGVK